MPSNDENPPVIPPRLRGLDGLRAIAVIAVIVHHFTPGAIPGGYLGVDLFFVISGFLITALLLRERDATGRIDLAAFWRRRARRLLPALALVLVSSSAVAWLIGGDVLVDLGRQLVGATTFTSNWLSIASGSGYFDTGTPELFRNLWSLAVEEQFYLVWPIVMMVVLALPNRAWCAAFVGSLAAGSIIAMAVLYVPGADATRVYYGTDTHSFGLAIGALLAVVTAVWPVHAVGWSRLSRFFVPMLAIPGIIGVLAGFIALPPDSTLAYRGGLAVVSVCSALLIAGSIVPGSWVGRALDARWLGWVGTRSYGLYLWHWPVLTLLAAATPAGIAAPWREASIVAGALAVTIAAASLSYRFVELPIRRDGFRITVARWVGGLRLSRRSAVMRLVVAVAVVASVAGMVAAIAVSPDRGQAEARVERGRDAIANEPAPNDPAAPGPSSVTSTEPKTPPGGDEVTAIGDSVMLASAPELQTAFPGIQIDAVVSRQLSDAPPIVAEMAAAGSLRPVVLIGLGTNGPIDEATLLDVKRAAGPDRELIVVNVQAPRGWTPGVNESLDRFAQQYRSVELANWRDAISGQLSLLARDQIHPGSRGGTIYAQAVRDAAQRLAELPARASVHGARHLPRPE